MMFRRSRRRHARSAAAVLLAVPAFASAQTEAEDAPRTSPVVVSGTRSAQRAFDLPMSIDQISGERLREGQAGVNASEALVAIPGVVANNRYNMAQDLQISIRGFGARSTFGVRGIRLYADGIPLTMPDGQGQAANLDLMSAKSMEVLRGPFSALYGNSSGGVISVFTEDGPETFTLQPYGFAGSYDTWRTGLKFGGTNGKVNYTFNVSRFETNGYRDWSAARRDLANGKLTVDIDEDSRFTLVMNYLTQPDTQDPQGLTQAQVQQNPRQVGVVGGGLTSRDYGVRKSIDNGQIGGLYERRLDSQNSVRAMLYAGDRQVQQYLGITPGAQAAPGSSGGVVDLDRQFFGTDLRWIHRNQIASMPVTVSVGLNYDRQNERRKGWNNFLGAQIGVQGILRRDENNVVYNFDQYIQAELNVTDRWLVSGGIRNSEIRFSSEDYYIQGSNRNDSGSISYSNVSPVGGVLYKATETLHLYANAGRGFETPTFAELAYRPIGDGFNFDLKPNRTRNFEVGAKALVGKDTRVNLALFDIKGDNEITVLTNIGGRATYQNAGKSTRQGVELLVDSRLPAGVYVIGAATYLEAKFDQSYMTCTAAPCGIPNVPVQAGSKIPGVPEFTFYGELGWRKGGFSTAVEARHSAKVYVNDQNSEAASAYDLFNLRFVYAQPIGKAVVTGFFRVDNIADKQYVGSVIVNGAGGRFYEPSPGRNYLVGLSASLPF